MDYYEGSFHDVIEKKREDKTIMDSQVRQTLGHWAWDHLGLVMSQVLRGWGLGQRGGQGRWNPAILSSDIHIWRYLHIVVCTDLKRTAWCACTVTHSHTLPRSRRRTSLELHKSLWFDRCLALRLTCMDSHSMSSFVSGFFHSSWCPGDPPMQ